MIKFRKIVGLVLWHLLAKRLPPTFSPLKLGQRKLRALCGKLILDRCGKNVCIEKGAIFSTKVELGERSGIGLFARILGKTFIGDDVMMGPFCVVYTQNHRFDDVTVPMHGQGFQEEKPVRIGNDVWLGDHAILLPGVTVGSHSIVGAGAVVSKDVPEWAIVAGNPAVVKKYRKRTSAELEKPAGLNIGESNA